MIAPCPEINDCMVCSSVGGSLWLWMSFVRKALVAHSFARRVPCQRFVFGTQVRESFDAKEAYGYVKLLGPN